MLLYIIILTFAKYEQRPTDADIKAVNNLRSWYNVIYWWQTFVDEA
jgi:hypothetical protein